MFIIYMYLFRKKKNKNIYLNLLINLKVSIIENETFK